ncbi:MAG: DsbA family protein [Anaerolineales bacterium]|nr:DsbA family protein [Anaerolineales bacterium]
MSKRQEIREKRRKQQQRQRLLIIGMVAVGAVLIAAALVLPTLRPVGDFVQITPQIYSAAVDMNAIGNPDAPVRVEVWEDFQCPACQGYTENTESLLLQNYVETGKVYYIFHHFPFIDNNSTTKESDQAANASMCAGEQGRFWDYHNMLFINWDGENQGAFADNRLIAFANSLNLNMSDFKACFTENRYSEQISQDFEAGKAKGVTSTPNIFVDGIMVLNSQNSKYVPTYGDVAAAIEAALAGK